MSVGSTENRTTSTRLAREDTGTLFGIAIKWHTANRHFVLGDHLEYLWISLNKMTTYETTLSVFVREILFKFFQ